MVQILQKRAPALTIRAGHLARELILQQGLQPEQVDIVPGAAGGPKGIGIQGLDQAIFGEFFPRAPQRRTLVGSSIGSWRFASMAAHGAQQGTERLGELYTNLYFHKKMTRQDVSDSLPWHAAGSGTRQRKRSGQSSRLSSRSHFN